jgi:hypothetical protein
MICTMPKAKKEKVSFRYVWETHLQPSNVDAKCTPKHIKEMELYLTRWEAFWNQSKRKQPKVQRCEREHLETYRRHLISLDRYSDRSINKHLGVIRSLLVSAAKHGLLKRRPMLEQLPDVSLDPARKIWLRDEQIDSLMSKTDSLVWPARSFTGIDAADWWRCALVLYRTYGFRPQELLAYDAKKTPITWANISFGIVRLSKGVGYGRRWDAIYSSDLSDIEAIIVSFGNRIDAELKAKQSAT